ncbi:MAG: hypothetical protein HFG92_12515 [Dorea sp.]|nr:hypothetical protein [Dorea sp.]
MKVLALENKLEDLENDLLIIYETANALHILLSEGSVTEEQADTVLWGITNSISNSLGSIKWLVEETMKTRKILESI